MNNAKSTQTSSNRPWRTALVVAALAGVGILTASQFSHHGPATPPPATPEPVRAAAAPLPPKMAETPTEPDGGIPDAPPILQSVAPNRPTDAGTRPAKAAPVAPALAGGQKPGPADPLARVALGMVGADGEAEAYWRDAINDPSLSAHERQDLIEDLNEDGLSDPKHPAPEDLPIILARLQLIEDLAPDALDKVNADAFQEAYKDLVNLADLALGGGVPVR